MKAITPSVTSNSDFESDQDHTDFLPLHSMSSSYRCHAQMEAGKCYRNLAKAQKQIVKEPLTGTHLL